VNRGDVRELSGVISVCFMGVLKRKSKPKGENISSILYPKDNKKKTLSPPFAIHSNPRLRNNFHPLSNESGSKKLANAQPTFPPAPSPSEFPTPSIPSFLQSNKQSSPSSTQSGNLGCMLGCPASCNTSKSSPSLNVKNGNE
jgi:hypothetical protein